MRLINNKQVQPFIKKCYYLLNNRRKFSKSKRGVILGIETSCDDTGCAIVDTEGNVLGEALHSQQLIHLNNGGIIPPIAQDLHRKNIENIVNEAVKSAQIPFSEIDAIAATVKPGLPLSLNIGTKYGKYLCRLHKKPFIPIHHMEAHALTARMHDKSIQFPFLVLLISGGHCLLAVAEKVDKFLLLGESKDDAPGEAFDKLARRMKLKNLPEYSQLCGGQAIEKAALKDVPPDGIIPGVNNLCSGLQLVMTRHIAHRVQRGMEYVARKQLIPPDKQVLVVSGGAACNNFIATGLQMVCDQLDYKMVRPPPKLCTDNGVMIAWNGVERWKENIGVLEDFEDVEIEKCSPLGERLVENVAKESISCNWVKLTKLSNPQSKWSDID